VKAQPLRAGFCRGFYRVLENSEEPQHEDQADGNTQQPKDNRHSASPASSQSENAHDGGVFPSERLQIFEHWVLERSSVETQMDEILVAGVPPSMEERQARRMQFLERRDEAARLLLDDLRRRQGRCGFK
jgi:hypothetical protein